MDRESEAEAEFRILAQNAPDDLLSTTQLGFLLYARGEKTAAMPLFDRVLASQDDDLANRVRAVLRMPQVLRPRAGGAPQSIDAKIMAERSIKAGYMKDALKYLEVAHESDPGDFDVMRKLAWTNNILHRDHPAYLSEGPVILAVGAATQTWHGVRPWGEAGSAISYVKGHMLPDYRGGVSVTRGLHREDSGWLADATLDALYVSRFDHDFLAYTQSRAGYDFG